MKTNKSTSIEVYKLKSGETRYKFQIYLGKDPLTGKDQRTTRSGFKTKKAAQLELSRMRLAINDGTFKNKQNKTYNDVYTMWVVQYKKTVEDSTFNKTLGYFRNHILPSMGEYKIEQINVEVCQQHVNEWHEKLQKYRTIKAYAAKVMKFAMKRGYISANPFDLVDLPGTKQDKKQSFNSENFYTKEQLNQFLNILEKESNFKIYVFFRLLAYSGVRKGEAFALHWGDINFDRNEIVINKAITRGSTNNLYIKSTKTGIGRILKMDDKTMQLLKEWQSKQKILFGNTIKSNPDEQLVFSNTNNELVQPTKAQQWIKLIQDKYNLHKITPHGLRHTHCSLLFEAGATLKEVQDRMGHNDVQTTLNIYTHVTKKAQINAINKFNLYLNES